MAKNVTMNANVQVQFQGVREGVQDIKEVFSKIKVGTELEKTLTDLFNRVSKKAESIGSSLGKGLTTQGQLGKAQRDLNELVNLLQSFGKEAQSIKLDDVVHISGDAQIQLDKYSKSISNIEKQLENVKKANFDAFSQSKNLKTITQTPGYSMGKTITAENIDGKLAEASQKAIQTQGELEKLIKKYQQFSAITSEKGDVDIGKISALKQQLQDLIGSGLFDKAGNWKEGVKTQVDSIIQQLGSSLSQAGTELKSAGGIDAFMKNLFNPQRIQIGVTQFTGYTNQLRLTNQVIASTNAAQKEWNNTQEKTTQEISVLNTKLTEQNSAYDNLKTEIAQQQTGVSALTTKISSLSDAAENTGVAVEDLAEDMTYLKNEQRGLDNIQNSVKHWASFAIVLNTIKRVVNSVVTDIKELDKAMVEIAVVSDMTTVDLWNQFDAYSALAEQYGTTTKGVYEVAQLYFQQGLKTAEVNKLIEETLKFARVAGIDYANATDYMTVAIRNFNIGMDNAVRVTDVYSKVAAVSASDTEELAVAMSKTASSSALAGSSFENTTAFLAQMIERTRESAETIGTALRSITSRFLEMKKAPGKIIEVEGEEAELNKVETALAAVGISLTDTTGQFRDFDDVIFELSEKWNTLDRNTQAYIATQAAGIRNQSRFIALVSDYTRLQELSADAYDSEDAALLQYSKTLDSVEAKINQIGTSFQQFYTQLINGPVVKTFLDTFNFILKQLNGIPPILLGIILPGAIKLIKLIATQFLSGMQKGMNDTKRQGDITAKYVGKAFGKSINVGITEGAQQGFANAKALSTNGEASAPKFSFADKSKTAIGGAGSFIGSAMAGIGSLMNVVSIVSAAVTVGIAIVNSFSKSIDELKEDVQNANIARAESKQELKDLTSLKKKYDELSKSRHENSEAQQQWVDLNNELAEKYPELISYIDAEGNAVVDLTSKYDDLAKAKTTAAIQSQVDYSKSQIELAQGEIASQKGKEIEITGNFSELENRSETNIKKSKGIIQKGYGTNISDEEMGILYTLQSSAQRKPFEKYADTVKRLEKTLSQYSDETVSNWSEDMQNIFRQITSNLAGSELLSQQTISKQQNLIVEYEKAALSGATALQSYASQADVLKEMTNAQNIMSNLMESAYNKYYQEGAKTNSAETREGYVETQRFFEDYAKMEEVLNDYWKNLTLSQKDRFDSLLSNITKYNSDDLFSEGGVLEQLQVPPEIRQQIQDSFTKTQEAYFNRFGNALNNYSNLIGDTLTQVGEGDKATFTVKDTWFEKIPEAVSEGILKQLDIYEQMFKTGAISEGRAQEMSSAYLSVIQHLSDSIEDPIKRFNAFTQLQNADLLSRDGIEEAYKSIAELDESIKITGVALGKLQPLWDQVVLNPTIALQKAISDYGDSIEATADLISKQDKGFSVADAQKYAASLGKSMSELFKVEPGTGKLVLKDFEAAIEEGQTKFNKSLIENFINTFTIVNEAVKGEKELSPDKIKAILSQNGVDDYTASLILERYSSLLGTAATLTGDNLEEFFSYLKNQLGKAPELQGEADLLAQKEAFESKEATTKFRLQTVEKLKDDTDTIINTYSKNLLEGFDETDLTSLAKISGKSLSELSDSYNSLADKSIAGISAWLLSLAEDLGIDTQSQQFKDSISQVIMEFNNQFSKYLEEGLKGTLRFEDLRALESTTGLNLDFTQTQKGLKLTKQSAIDLSLAMQKLNSSLGSMAMEQMADYLMETDTAYENTSSTLAKIRDLQTQINAILSKQGVTEGKITDEEKKQVSALGKELSIAKQILQVRSQQSKSFDFMSKDFMGETGEGFLTYVDNFTKAVDAIAGVDMKKGQMKANEFYSIMSHLMDTAKDSEQLNKYADMLSKGLSNIVITNGGAMVNLAETAGGSLKKALSEMTGGMDNGIKEMAKQQLKLIDAQIAALEAMKALETMDWGEGFQLSEEAAQKIEEIQIGLDYNFVDKRTGQIFTDMADWVGNLKNNMGETLSVEQFQNFFTTALASIDWDINDIEGSRKRLIDMIMQLMKEAGYDVAGMPALEISPPKLEWAPGAELDKKAAEVKLKQLIVDNTESIKNWANQLKPLGINVPIEAIPVQAEGETDQNFLNRLHAWLKEQEKKVEENPAYTQKLQIPVAVELLPENVTNDQVINKIKELEGKGVDIGDLKVDANLTAGDIADKGLRDAVNKKAGDLNAATYAVSGTVDVKGKLDVADAAGEAQTATQKAFDDKPIKTTFEVPTEESLAPITKPIADSVAKAIGEGIKTALSTIGTEEGALTFEPVEIPVSLEEDSFTLVTEKIKEDIENLIIKIKISTDPANLSSIKNDITSYYSRNQPTAKVKVTTDTSNAMTAVNNLISQINSKSATVKVTTSTTNSSPSGTSGKNTPMATGNINNLGPAYAEGNLTSSKVSGKTLMGELGPELYVANGRYYVVGQNGAEFVDLPKNAIVFNHKQTQGIFNGQWGIRGGFAMAEGNFSGPAKASIDEALSALYAARKVWSSLLDIDVGGLVDKARSGSKGGGKKNEDAKDYAADLELWYNWLRQIAKAEADINNLIAKRQNLLSGYDYVDNLREQQALLVKQAQIQNDLLKMQSSYLAGQAQKIANDSRYNKYIETTPEGLLQYKQGAISQLSSLQFGDADEKQSFFEDLQSIMDEYDSLYDTVQESVAKIEDLKAAVAEIEQELIDNQLALEKLVYESLEQKMEKEIDLMKEQIDLQKEANQNYIDGLKAALEQEKRLYQRSETRAEREQMQRRLELLQRTGGSPTEIASLQKQIDSRLQSEYFQGLQDNIDRLQEALDKQIQLLEMQYRAQQEQLEYMKESGLLWDQVADIMSRSEQEIFDFITTFHSDFSNISALAYKEATEELRMNIQTYIQGQITAPFGQYLQGIINAINTSNTISAGQSNPSTIYDNPNSGISGGGGSSGGTSGGGSSGGSGSYANDQGGYSFVTPSGGIILPKVSQLSQNLKRGDRGEAVAMLQQALLGNGIPLPKYGVDGKFEAETETAVKQFQMMMGLAADGVVGASTKAKFALRGYKTGGRSVNTELAVLHGSLQKPEQILNATQTKNLDSMLADYGKGSIKNLINLFSEMQGMLIQLVKTFSQEQSNKPIVQFTGNNVFNFETDVISTDYDAKKAGQVAAEEYMLQIAQKMGTMSVERR